MIESPLLQELLEQRRRETCHTAILVFLEARFGSVPPEFAKRLRTVADEAELEELCVRAGRCLDLDTFRHYLS